MSDIALSWDATQGAADFARSGNDVLADDGLETAVLLSLFLDRRAEPGDPLPPGETDRRGWWGDAFPVVDGDLVGSRLWMLARETERPVVLQQVEEYAREALDWLLLDRVADRVDVTVTVPRRGVWGLAVDVYRPKRDPVRYRFDYAWAAQERG